jgi:hypothetical protein
MMKDVITFLLDNLVSIIFNLIAWEKYQSNETDGAIFLILIAIFWKLLFSL